MPHPNTSKTLADKARYFPKPAQKCVSVFWTCIVHNTNTDKEAPRRIETFWRFKTEPFDATTEAVEALVKPYEKVIMLTDVLLFLAYQIDIGGDALGRVLIEASVKTYYCSLNNLVDES